MVWWKWHLPNISECINMTHWCFLFQICLFSLFLSNRIQVWTRRTKWNGDRKRSNCRCDGRMTINSDLFMTNLFIEYWDLCVFFFSLSSSLLFRNLNTHKKNIQQKHRLPINRNTQHNHFGPTNPSRKYNNIQYMADSLSLSPSLSLGYSKIYRKCQSKSKHDVVCEEREKMRNFRFVG